MSNELFLNRDWAADHAETVDRLPLADRFSLTYLPGALDGARSILDIGCGGGQLKRYVDSLQSGVRYCGADFSLASLAESRRRMPGEWLVQADGGRLPLESGSFDLTYQHDVLMHHPRPLDMLREMYRVARRAVVFNARMSLRLKEVLTLEARDHPVLYQTLPIDATFAMLKGQSPAPSEIRFRVVETMGVHKTRFKWDRQPHYRSLLGLGRQLHVHAVVTKGHGSGRTRVINETPLRTRLEIAAATGFPRGIRFVFGN